MIGTAGQPVWVHHTWYPKQEVLSSVIDAANRENNFWSVSEGVSEGVPGIRYNRLIVQIIPVLYKRLKMAGHMDIVYPLFILKVLTSLQF